MRCQTQHRRDISVVRGIRCSRHCWTASDNVQPGIRSAEKFISPLLTTRKLNTPYCISASRAVLSAAGKQIAPSEYSTRRAPPSILWPFYIPRARPVEPWARIFPRRNNCWTWRSRHCSKRKGVIVAGHVSMVKYAAGRALRNGRLTLTSMSTRNINTFTMTGAYRPFFLLRTQSFLICGSPYA